MQKKELIQKIKQWIKENALSQTTSSDRCWDDGDIMFKRTDTTKQGDWSQEEWDKKVKEFEEEYLDYKELLEFLDSLEVV